MRKPTPKTRTGPGNEKSRPHRVRLLPAALAVLVLLAAGLLPAPVRAQTSIIQSGRPRALSSDEEDARKKKWQSLPRKKQEEYRRRLKKFKEMPEKERELYRRRSRQLRKLSPQERQRLKNQLNSWERLSPEERERVRKKFMNRLIPPAFGPERERVG